jgi:membrane fusion protein (multidrug efflux system)
LQVEALKTKLRQQLAELESARNLAVFGEHEYDRKRSLVASNFTSAVSYERAETDLKVARQTVASVEQQIAGTTVALNNTPDIEVDRHPTVRAAKTELDRALLDLSYSDVVAPDSGIVTKVDDLQVGNFVNAGATVFSLLSSQNIWIEANFRELDLTYMRTGQAATVVIDAYPDRTYNAHIVSLSPGTGSDFSVLPPENATGNWVKIVQRLTVRLGLDEAQVDRPLFSGMSVTVEVDTGHHSALWYASRNALALGAAR